MKTTYNAVQVAYMLHKANVEVLTAQADQMELGYITAHKITNADGSTPTKSWHIDDDAVFDAMMNDIGDALNEIGVGPAEQALRIAADDLIHYGLSLMPECYAKERQTLENNCFGLNGCSRSFHKPNFCKYHVCRNDWKCIFYVF